MADSLPGNDRCYRHEMSDDDHRALAATLRKVKGMVVISGYPCDLYDRELYPDWARVERGHEAMNHSLRTEVLWINDRAMNAVPDVSDLSI